MDWDLKMPPWDFSELEQNVEPSIVSGVSSSGGLGRQTGRLDCSVDLKLGGLGDFGPSVKWKEQPTVSTTASSSGSSKRARAPGNCSQNVSCAVEGCKSDLSNCREYHRRHKVCEVHSKTPVVRVGGQEQRFCQQCSRFHLLVEFDEEKRSCRKRLDGHNRRRRKLQPESCNSGGFFLNHQGTMFSSYPQMLPSSTTPEPKWPGFIKTEEEALYTPHPPLHYPGRQQHFPGSSISYREGKQFPFLQDGNTTLSSRMALESSSLYQPLHKTISRVESSGSRMFSDGLAQALESDCALSLLSSPTQTPSINLGQLVQADRVSMGQPLVSGLQYSGLVGRYSRSQASNDVSTAGFSCSGIEEVEHVGGALVSDDGDAGIHCQGMFHVAGEGSSDGASRALTFPWQ